MKVNVLEVSLGRQSSQVRAAELSLHDQICDNCVMLLSPDLVYQHITPGLPPLHSQTTSWGFPPCYHYTLYGGMALPSQL